MLFNQTYMYMYIMHIHAYTLLSDLIGNSNVKKYILMFTETQLSSTQAYLVVEIDP